MYLQKLKFHCENCSFLQTKHAHCEFGVSLNGLLTFRFGVHLVMAWPREEVLLQLAPGIVLSGQNKFQNLSLYSRLRKLCFRKLCCFCCCCCYCYIQNHVIFGFKICICGWFAYPCFRRSQYSLNSILSTFILKCSTFLVLLISTLLAVAGRVGGKG